MGAGRVPLVGLAIWMRSVMQLVVCEGCAVVMVVCLCV